MCGPGDYTSVNVDNGWLNWWPGNGLGGMFIDVEDVARMWVRCTMWTCRLSVANVYGLFSTGKINQIVFFTVLEKN